ncbi:30S ribosomal protein S13 [Candidatus Woesearchaeota archaeon]|nr:30S ribosomal protein S13 [Candidatus Woesearchaeota archaeon]
MIEDANYKHIVRVVNTDIKGEVKLASALRRIQGVGFTYSNAVIKTLNMEENIKIGNVSDSDLKKIEDVIINPAKYNLPSWLFNRRKNFDSGSDIHLLTSDLKLQKDNDIKRMKKIRSYKGVRHSIGQPVRGQRTRSNFRKGSAIGVNKKKSKIASAKPAIGPKEKTKDKGKK